MSLTAAYLIAHPYLTLAGRGPIFGTHPAHTASPHDLENEGANRSRGGPDLTDRR